ncbi:MAG: lysophospholipid acyltransferase family protein [Alkalispirochaeta sp.]|jgi:1-acyl-sn-glycerol-3-phosphate acyltransferase
MRAYLLFTLIFFRLICWDILDKLRIAVSWKWARRALDREVPQRARKLFALARFSVGLSLMVENRRRVLPETLLIVSNHQSVIDIVAIMAAFPNHAVRFVAKKELGSWFPAVSRVLRVQRHALISRHGDFGAAMRRIERLGRTIRQGEGVVIFPEGTRSLDGKVRTFHSGAIRKIQASRPLPMVAVAVDGGWRFARMQDLTRMERGQEVRIAFCNVFPPAQSKRELITQLDTAQQDIERTIKGWREAGRT